MQRIDNRENTAFYLMYRADNNVIVICRENFRGIIHVPQSLTYFNSLEDFYFSTKFFVFFLYIPYGIPYSFKTSVGIVILYVAMVGDGKHVDTFLYAYYCGLGNRTFAVMGIQGMGVHIANHLEKSSAYCSAFQFSIICGFCQYLMKKVVFKI